MPRITAIFDADSTALRGEAGRVIAVGEKVSKSFSARKEIFEAETRLMQAQLKGETAKVAVIQQEIALLKVKEQREQAIAAISQKIMRNHGADAATAVKAAEDRLRLETAIARQQERAARFATPGAPLPGGRIPVTPAVPGGKPGARPAGKGGGESYSAGQNATDAYNIAQDFYFAGFAGISNNLPRLAQLVKQIPSALMRFGKALGPIGALVAVTAGAATWAGTKVYGMLNEEADAFENYRKQREAAERKARPILRQRKIDRDTFQGGLIGASAQSSAADTVSRLGIMREEAERTKELRTLEASRARQKIEFTRDEEIRAKKLAEFDAAELKRQADAEVEAAARRVARATSERNTANSAYVETSKRVASIRNGSGGYRDGLTPAEETIRDKDATALPQMKAAAESLDQALAAETRTLQEAYRRQQIAKIQSDDIIARQKLEADQRQAQRSREATEAGWARAEELARKATERIKDRINVFFNNIESGVKTLQDAAKDRADKAKNLREGREDTRVAELRGRGQNERADRLQRRIDINRTAEDLREKEGLSPEEARREAERRVNAKDPRRARRIGLRKDGADVDPDQRERNIQARMDDYRKKLPGQPEKTIRDSSEMEENAGLPLPDGSDPRLRRRAPRGGLDDRGPWKLDRKSDWRMDNRRFPGLDGPGAEAPDIKGPKPTIKGVGYKGPEAKRDEAPAGAPGGGDPLIVAALRILGAIENNTGEVLRNQRSRAQNR